MDNDILKTIYVIVGKTITSRDCVIGRRFYHDWEAAEKALVDLRIENPAISLDAIQMHD